MMYVNMDKCWQASSRVNRLVVADSDRFPSGINVIADVGYHQAFDKQDLHQMVDQK